MGCCEVGYGDITPQTRAEYALAVVLVTGGCMTFTYLMATFLSLASELDEEPWTHARRMDT